jgi:NADH dehydrogenase [ubiquinone] 1 alpha subcomplex assembly factor 1
MMVIYSMIIFPFLMMNLNAGDTAGTENPGLVLVRFNDPGARAWSVVNDDVMGGISTSQFRISGDGTAVFTGRVSLENNGGFASARTRMQADLDDHDGIIIRVKGDGKTYGFRLRTASRGRVTPYSWEAMFMAPAGEWTEIKLPFSSFRPVYRGRQLVNVPDLDMQNIAEAGLMVSNGQAGPFELELDWIAAGQKIK